MAIGPCKNPDCPNHTLRVRTRNGFCDECHAAIAEAKTKYLGRTRIPGPESEPFEKIEGLPAQEQSQATPSAQDVTCDDAAAEEAAREAVSPILDREEVAAMDAAVERDHSGELTTMVPDLPEDLDRPFSLGGFDFRPAPQRRMVGSRLAAITAKSLSIRTCVSFEHGLYRYGFARIAVSTDGTALAIKFYAERRPGSCKIQRKRRSSALIAMEPLIVAHPEWIGREAALEWMGVEGWFLMRVGGEKGEAA